MTEQDLILQLVALGRSFTRTDARELWQGDLPFQSLWSKLTSKQIIKRRKRRGVDEIKSKGYLWRVATKGLSNER